MKIYHNPRCSQSRGVKKMLEDNNINIEVVEYLKNPPSKEDLKGLLLKLGANPSEIVRKSEKIYKENFKGKTLTEEEWLNALVKYPILMERPIFVNGEKAVIGRPPEKILEIL